MTARRDDTERDAWLREALRHAPDADAAPPAALSDAILRQARAATTAHAPTAPPPRMAAPRHGMREPLAALWALLARPSFATGFAGVMVATVVGMLWWGRPMDEAAMPRPATPPVPAVESVAKAPAAATAAAPVLEPATPAAPPMDADAARAMEKPAPGKDMASKVAALPPVRQPAPLPMPASVTDGNSAGARDREAIRQDMGRGADDRAAQEAARATATAKASPGELPDRAMAPAPKAAANPATEAASPLRATAPASTEGPTPAVAAAAPQRVEAEAVGALNLAPAPQVLSRAGARAAAQEASAAHDAAMPSKPGPVGSAGAARLAAAPQAQATAPAVAPASAALRALQQSVAAEPARWSWQRGDGAAQAMAPALQAWIARLGDSDASVAAHSADGAPPALRLLRDGRLHSTVVLADAQWRLLPAEPGQPATQWPLSPAAAAALRESLDAATR